MEVNDLFNWLAYFGHFVLAINTFIYFKSYRKKPVAFKIFSFYLLFCLLIQITSSTIRHLGLENLFLSHYYFIGQFILISIFYKNLIKGVIQKKVISIILILVLILLGVYYVKYPLKYFSFNVVEIIITSIPILVYCFIFLLQRIDDPRKKYIYISSGIFLYLLCSTLLFVTGNIGTSIQKYIWYSNVILYLIYQTLVFIEWYKHFRKKKEPSEISV